jgi:hypothetical protein
MKTTPASTAVPTGRTYFSCGEVGHYANMCPRRMAQSSSGQKMNPSVPVQNANQQQGNHGQRTFAQGKVNHVTVEAAQEAPDVVLGMFLVNSHPAFVLFDSGATHSFITAQYVSRHNLLMQPLERAMLVSSPGGVIKAENKCKGVMIKIRGGRFPYPSDSLGDRRDICDPRHELVDEIQRDHPLC